VRRTTQVPDRGDSSGRRRPGGGGRRPGGARRAGRRQRRRFGFDWHEFDWGCEYYARTGRMMAGTAWRSCGPSTPSTSARSAGPACRTTSALGPATGHLPGLRPVGERASRALPAGVRSPLRKADDTELDWVVVRENSEGEYAGLGGRNLSSRGPGHEVRFSQPCSPRSAANASCALPSTWHAPRPAQGLQRHQEQCPAVRHGPVG